MDITPGIIHYANRLGNSACAIEYTSDYEEDDDAEYIYTHNATDVNCLICLMNMEEIKTKP